LMFGELYATYLDGSHRATSDYTDKDIQKAILIH